MPVSNFTVGRDLTIVIVTPQGVLNPNLITGFQSKQDIVEEKIKGLDGVTRYLRYPDAWTGSFNYQRQDPILDRYFNKIEADYYAGLQEQPSSITQTVQEVSGAVSQFRYVNALFKYDDAGSYKGDSSVNQLVTFVAWRRMTMA